MANELSALTIIFTEFYFWITIPFMFLIHVGFCLYEVGVSRQKNSMHTLMKNAMLIPTITIAFYLVGWWMYFAFPNGPGITGGLIAAPWALPWSELIGPHLGGAPASDALTAEDTAGWARSSGVVLSAFIIFAWTAGSILSGAVIERIRSSAFWMLAILVGAFTWVLAAAWGWSPAGWMVQKLGYHDAYGSGVIHAVCGGAALGILLHLGPRLGRFKEDGTPRAFPPRNAWMVIIGIFMLYTGFWGFYAACHTPIAAIASDTGAVYFSAVTIYGNPTTLGAVTLNYIFSLVGGLLMAYWVSRGDAFWTFSGGIGGIITASSGNDMYHPVQAMLIGALGIYCAHKLHYWVEKRFKLDDAVGAVAIHGYCGVIGIIACGFVLWGYPSSPTEGYPAITPWGQIAGSFIMFIVLGFAPTYAAAGLLKKLGMLRIPFEVELAGLDHEHLLEEEQQAAELLIAEREDMKKRLLQQGRDGVES
jgi:ammonia channel protein AmtB